MMIHQQKILRVGLLALLISSLGLVACRISSSDSVARDVDINIAGVYRNGGNPVVANNTGAPIEWLNMVQTGSRLQAVDNNGIVFRGNIGSVSRSQAGNAATFTLKGTTTTGSEGIISGTISVSGENVATMRGTWAEPSAFGNVVGTATVAGPQPPDPQPPENGNGEDDASSTLPPFRFDTFLTAKDKEIRCICSAGLDLSNLLPA